MQFSTLALAALASVVSAQSTVSVVQVGNGGTTFKPDNIKVNAGEFVQFQFMGGNHTVTQSTFAQPCQAISSVNSSIPGFHSGYVGANASLSMGMIATYTIQINNTNPVWIYCAQAKHCQNGMTMVINQAASGPNTLQAYRESAKGVAQSSVPGGAAVSGGQAGSTTSGGGSAPGTSTTPAAAGSMLSVPSTLGLLALAAGSALLL